MSKPSAGKQAGGGNKSSGGSTGSAASNRKPKFQPKK